MINDRVPDLHALLATLRGAGCTVDGKWEKWRHRRSTAR
jgi:hypothetical protein